MHSYQHNIKTFNNATRHLTRVERSLYRDLIELYYDTEQPLPAADFDRLCRRVLANSDEERAALQFVLDEFFELTGDVYTHDFCDEVIEKYHSATTAKAKAGKASAEARKRKAAAKKQARKEQKSTGVKQPLNGRSTDRQQNSTNQKPLTSNQEPLTPHTPQGGESEVLEYLNLVAGKNFKDVESNLKLIRGRLADYPIETLKFVVTNKTSEWKGTAQEKYLRPETLFNKTKFEGYANEPPHNPSSGKHGRPSNYNALLGPGATDF